MASDVIMPQMGESIAEGTVTKWLKKVGDSVERDEPLFEISTDKVDAEIPSPQDGVLLEILVPEGETVEINTVVARIGTADELGAVGGASGEASGGSAASEAAPAGTTPAAPEAAPPGTTPSAADVPPTSPAAASAARSPASPETGSAGTAEAGSPEAERQRRIATKSSPVVRRIAAEHGIDLQQVPGTGVHGRVTKKDILAFIESGGAGARGAGAPAGTGQAGPVDGGEAEAAAAGSSAPMGAVGSPMPAGTYHPEGGTMLGVSGWPAKLVQSYLSGVSEGDRVEKLSTRCATTRSSTTATSTSVWPWPWTMDSSFRCCAGPRICR